MISLTLLPFYVPLLLTTALEPPSTRSYAASPATAPSRAGEVQEVREERQSLEKRILHLRDGRVLRTVCRWSEEGWQYRVEGEWRTLEPGSVRAWRSEKDLLRERAQRSRTLAPTDLTGRTELAGWLAGVGLAAEAFEELDAVLRVEPDHPVALELIRRTPFSRPSGGDPAAEPELYVTRLLAAAVGGGPALRELCILSLGSLLETPRGEEVLRERLAEELLSYRVLRRTLAAHALRRLLPGAEVRELLRRCALDTSRPVREEAARALRDTDEPGVVVPLVKALASEARPVRTNAAEALGKIGFPVAVPALVAHFAALPATAGSGGTRPPAAHIHIGTEYAYVGDFDVEIAQGASIADPIVMQVQEAVVLDARIGGISGYTEVIEYRVVRCALEQLTGAAPGSSPEAWKRWYEENRSRFEPRGAEDRVAPGR